MFCQRSVYVPNKVADHKISENSEEFTCARVLLLIKVQAEKLFKTHKKTRVMGSSLW